jgi:hypothetical protein
MHIVDSLAPIRSVTGRNRVEDGTAELRRPEDRAGWEERYNWLDAAFYGEPYSTGDITALGLFRAVDENGDELSITKRLLQDWRFVIETAASRRGPAGRQGDGRRWADCLAALASQPAGWAVGPYQRGAG